MAAPSGKLKIESKDCRINYNLLPGEKLLTCPYNLSHAILPIKFGKHVLNCARLHVKEQAAKGEEPLFERCSYDGSHHYRKELKAHHLATCEARLRSENDDNYGWDSDPEEKTDPTNNVGVGAEAGACGGADAAAQAAGTSSYQSGCWNGPYPTVEPQDVPLSPEDDWDALPASNKQFDAEKRIAELRRSGYGVIKYPQGMTKSERMDFYKKDADVLARYDRLCFLERVKRDNYMKKSGSTGSNSMANTTATVTSNPSDKVMMPISEEGHGGNRY